MHSETDSMRVERLTITIDEEVNKGLTSTDAANEPSLKSLDCSECGVIFSTVEDKKIHDSKEHNTEEKNKEDYQKEAGEEDDSECDDKIRNLSIKSEFYEIREYPENNIPDDTELDKVYGARPKLDQQGITMKGKSQTFKDASTVLKTKLQKGKNPKRYKRQANHHT